MAGYECQNFKDGQVLAANSLNKIEDALAGLCNNGPIFTATYGSTTSAELKTAYDEGNTLVLKGYIDNMDCVLSFTLYDETNNEFTFTGVDCDKIISATLKDDIWARSVTQTGDTYSFAEGTQKGAIAVTTNGETENITVHGLGEAAFLNTDSFDQSGEAKKALEDAKTYTDEKISALINGAPTTLDTLDEIAAALKDNDNIVTTLEQSIGSKANASDLTSLSNTVEGVANTALSAKSDVKDLRVEILPHLSNTSNPHKVTAEQAGAIPASGSNARPTYNDKDLAFKSDIRTYSLKKDGSTIKLIGSDGEETSVNDTEGATIFIAIRGQTTFAECLAAYNAGKLLYCDVYDNGTLFPCVWGDTDTHFAFAGVFPGGSALISVNLLHDSGWQDMVTTEIPADVSVATGTLNGTIEITKNGTKNDVAVKGLGTAAYCDAGAFDTSGAASIALSNAKSYTDTKVAALVNGAPDALDTLDELAAALKDNAGIVDTLNEAIGKKANASDLTNLQAQVNKKANDYSISLYNGTGGNPKPVKFLTVNYSTCGSESGVAIKIGMVSGHGNGVSYAFLQDAIIKVSHTGVVEVDNFKYYGAATDTYDGAKRQYGDIFWLIDTTNKIVDFYCLMGQYATVLQIPFKRVNSSSGGTITQHTSCAVYSSGTKVWANNSDIALMSDIPQIDAEAIYSSVAEAKSDVKDLRDDFAPHLNNASNPHGVTAAQTGALPLAGGLMNGSMKFQDSSLPQKALQFVCGIDAFAQGGEMGWQSKDEFLAGCLKTLPDRLKSYQDHTIAVSDPNSAVETGFYYIDGATNRPPFSQNTNIDYRVLTTAYSDQWLQQIATDFRCTDVFVRRRENGTWKDWARLAYSSEVETANSNALEAKSDIKDMRESLAGYETTSAATNKLLEAKAYTDTGVSTAKGYTDTAISNLINSAPSTLDTLGEIATAMKNNNDVVSILANSVANKANASDLTSHTGNKSNPHGVTASQVGALPTSGGTLTGTLAALAYKSDASDAAIKPSDSNEVNFGSNANYIYFGYDNRVGSPGAVNTYYFGTHSGASGAKSGKIECGEIVEGGTTLSSKYAPIGLSTTVETLADSVREAQSDIKDVREEVIPLSRGGTGTSLAKTNNAIIRFSGSGNYFSKTATASGAMYATSANGAPTFGTLPIAQGGTGATDATTALANLGGLPLVGGKAVQGSPSADSTISSMNRFQSDLFVQGDGAAPNNPQVAGFYLGKSATDENRHMDIVSGDTYSYIDFNKAGNNLDFDVRLLVNVDNGYTDFTWDGSKTARVLNVQGAIQQYGQAVALKSELDALAARIAALETAPVITFTIAGTAYTAEQGMTWGQWVYSKYNTAGATLASDKRIQIGALVATNYGTGYQYDTYEIRAGAAYVISA